MRVLCSVLGGTIGLTAVLGWYVFWGHALVLAERTR